MKKASLKKYGKLLLNSITEDRITDLSAQSAYFLILALFPFLIVSLNLLMLFAESYVNEILQFLQILPAETYQTIEPIITNIISSYSTGVVWISLIIAFWSSSKGVSSIIRAMNVAFNVDNRKGFIPTQLKSLVFTFLLLVLIFAVLISMVFGEVIIDTVQSLLNFTFGSPVRRIIDIIRFLIPVFVMVIGFTVLFKKGPDFEREEGISIKSAFIGGIIATFGWLLITVVYSFYVSNMSNMSVTYGPLVGIMALFIWLNLSSLIILFTAEVISLYDTVVVKKRRISKEGVPLILKYY